MKIEPPAGESTRLSGQATAPGLAMGRAFLHRDVLGALPVPREIGSEEIDEEHARVDRALHTVLEDLKVSALRMETYSGPKLAAIFGAHEMMLQDASLRQEIRDVIERELLGGAQALAQVFRRWEAKLRAMPDTMLQERADDLADLEGRLLREIAGIRTTALEQMPLGRVLVAHRLLPSETVVLPQREVVAIVLEFGGPGSHAAMLARALGVPTVAQVPGATKRIAEGDEVIVDGFAGTVTVRPDAAARAVYATQREEVDAALRRTLDEARAPACTADGVCVSVAANVGSAQEVAAAAAHGADGVGLYRMEQYYLGRTTPPSEAELLAHFRALFAPMPYAPLTVRLLDLGADKPISFLHFPLEDDPFLGRRGIRLLLAYPELLDTQLRALLEFSRDHDLRILVPMVTLAREMVEVRRRLRAIGHERGIEKLPPLGAMIETPAAALTVGAITPHVDFLSLGTNDLTQYTMAAGRENPLVNEYFLEDHPAVLRLLEIVMKEAGCTPVALCGELGARLDCLPRLLQLGLRAVSVAAPLVPGVKDAIRRCRTVASPAL